MLCTTSPYHYCKLVLLKTSLLFLFLAVLESQYRMILPMAWNYFHEHYGGGPTVVTRLDFVTAGTEER